MKDNGWACKIGFADFSALPNGADSPMRKAVREAFLKLTGREPDFILSGWSARLTKVEREVVKQPGRAATSRRPSGWTRRWLQSMAGPTMWQARIGVPTAARCGCC